MSDLDLGALEALARAATPGPWRASDVDDGDHTILNVDDWAIGSAYQGERDQLHIAANSPTTTLALIARLREAERESDRLRHGQAIEGDFVCPDSLALTAAQARIAELEAALVSAVDLLADYDPLAVPGGWKTVDEVNQKLAALRELAGKL